MSHEDVRRTLLFLVRGDEVLLAMKKRGFGAGKWHGVGGKLEPGETVEQALVRECQEEVNVTPISYRKVAEHDFINDAATDAWNLFIYAYICDEWKGDPSETEEMAPKWFQKDDIPYDDMWDDDAHWLPMVLEGKKVSGVFTFDKEDRVLTHDIKEVARWN